jgi:hypothetical protein
MSQFTNNSTAQFQHHAIAAIAPLVQQYGVQIAGTLNSRDANDAGQQVVDSGVDRLHNIGGERVCDNHGTGIGRSRSHDASNQLPDAPTHKLIRLRHTTRRLLIESVQNATNSLEMQRRQSQKSRTRPTETAFCGLPHQARHIIPTVVRRDPHLTPQSVDAESNIVIILGQLRQLGNESANTRRLGG